MKENFNGLFQFIGYSEQEKIEEDLDVCFDRIQHLILALMSELKKLDDVLYRSFYGDGPKLFERRIG